ncbi:4-hydroxy-3-methylbut-2-enyl diphosphate reductase [Planctomycetales bacterium 10988]|nr:4-hydroxy-3-methylbut-2-enyl diphosphate reductase [Planctomycetales bacterium 10988]
MEILLANPRGFCAGVNMAIDSLDLALERFGTPLYVYHEIVHNQYVVNRFRNQGVTFVNHLSEVPTGSVVLFSAHGVSPEIRKEAKERDLTAIDATCPLVTKVHMEALRFAKKGYTILLIGHAGHDEVIGTMGEAPEAIELVETPEEVDQLVVKDPNKVAFLTQTTLSVDDANRVITQIRRRFPNVEGPRKDDICYATQNRQEAVRELAPLADLVLVMGSKNSSNSQRLAELGQTFKKPAYLIDGPHELEDAWFEGVEKVLITAGASAPEVVVQDTIQTIVDRYGATLQERTIREENVHFPLPKELRRLTTPS